MVLKINCSLLSKGVDILLKKYKFTTVGTICLSCLTFSISHAIFYLCVEPEII